MSIPFTLIAGPCVLESPELVVDMAAELKAISGRLGIRLLFKTSFDKANRSSGGSFRGPGMEKGLAVLAQLKQELGVQLLTDIQMGVWVFAIAALTRTSISAFEIPSSAMNPELTDDYAERTKLFGLRYWFGYVGTFGFTAFSLAVFFVATPEFARGQLNPEG